MSAITPFRRFLLKLLLLVFIGIHVGRQRTQGRTRQTYFYQRLGLRVVSQCSGVSKMFSRITAYPILILDTPKSSFLVDVFVLGISHRFKAKVNATTPSESNLLASHSCWNLLPWVASTTWPQNYTWCWHRFELSHMSSWWEALIKNFNLKIIWWKCYPTSQSASKRHIRSIRFDGFLITLYFIDLSAKICVPASLNRSRWC